jgi:hypothetical protein
LLNLWKKEVKRLGHEVKWFWLRRKEEAASSTNLNLYSSIQEAL